MQLAQPEVMRFETEPVRREVELYKTAPSAQAWKRVEAAFGALEERVLGLEALAQAQTGAERMATEQQIVDLKHRRDLHWTRAHTALVETEAVRRAEPVAERAVKAERAESPRVRRAERVDTPQPQPRIRAEPRGRASANFFQRLFR
ncbi:MAG: hypothetical protein NTZ46_10190 [Verrucomicrobia bacterium]|nr:hypothetical protein [Verrucomicrobiota bacterium]